MLIGDTGLQPSEMRLLFRGKEKEDGEPLHQAGVKDKAKLILVEDPAAREKKIQEQRKLEHIAKTCQAIRNIQGEVDKWALQVCFLLSQLLIQLCSSLHIPLHRICYYPREFVFGFQSRYSVSNFLRSCTKILVFLSMSGDNLSDSN